ncbi:MULTISPECIES: hypothetical protein [Actinomadura]|uniref:Uncharacterized protein n=1 Tax=Actinomadura yumaensis TaxID=111807 RepID=A0ABW2CW63_9ACTN|nr:hypothetical protein [Actinomadura sp. J1-007]MWK39549.1 hypothetical protein [Actinomadura sp. J1-007]
MVQMRLMHSDPDKVRAVAELVLPLLRASGVLMVGDETEIPNRRDGGLRIVVDVTAAGPAVRVTAEPGEPEDGSAAAVGDPERRRLDRP